MAGPFEDAVAKFANDEFSDTEEAVGAIATSGNPLAYRIISALQDGRLMADPDTKKVYVTEPDGKRIDAATGAPVDSVPDSAAAVRLNNRLRRTVEAALGGLTLLSPDPAKRIQAAQSVFKTPGLVAGDAWSKELPDSKDLIGDWVGKKCGNYNTKTNKCGGQGS